MRRIWKGDITVVDTEGLENLDASEIHARSIFGRSLGLAFVVLTMNLELHSMCRMKNHSQFHSCTLMLSGGRTRHGMCCWKSRIDDYWNVDGGRDLSEPWTGIKQFTILNERPPDGYTWSGEAADKNSSNIKTRQECLRQLNEEKNCSGLLTSRSSTMRES